MKNLLKTLHFQLILSALETRCEIPLLFRYSTITANPILSPVFQAGGIEEIQFMLYPKGYPETDLLQARRMVAAGLGTLDDSCSETQCVAGGSREQ